MISYNKNYKVLLQIILILLPAILVILVSACDSNMKKQLRLKPPNHGGIYVVAHRGAHNGFPENSIPAYQKAIDLGCDFIELDVRTTKDGKFVSIHNSTIDAYVDGVSGKVKDFTLEELRSLDIGNRISQKWAGTKIPTFEEVLKLCQGNCGIYLDLKEAPVEPLVDLVKKYNMQNNILWYAGDNELERIKELCPECIIMPDPGPEKNLPDLIDQFKPNVIAGVWRHYSKSFVKKCHQAGAIVIVDESDPECWNDAVKWGSDGIQTDFPEKLIAFLESQERIAE
jgi:glycerophosphoryl diester phosphodiesterase